MWATKVCLEGSHVSRSVSGTYILVFHITKHASSLVWKCCSCIFPEALCLIPVSPITQKIIFYGGKTQQKRKGEDISIEDVPIRSGATYFSSMPFPPVKNGCFLTWYTHAGTNPQATLHISETLGDRLSWVR